MDNNQDAPEVLETPEVVETTEETETEVEDDRDARIAALEKEKSDLEAKNKQLFARTKKQPVAQPLVTTDVSNKDILYLAKADIHEDDLDDVLEMARLKKITVNEAHKFLKPILDTRTEERKTANATQVRSGRGSAKVSGEELLAKAERTGEVPETEDGLLELFKARRARQFRSPSGKK